MFNQAANTATRTAATSAAASTHSQFGKITKSIVRARSEMGWQAYHVYTALLTYRSNATGLARVAIDTLASDTDIDRRHVQRGIAKLSLLGVVSLVGSYGPKGINEWFVALEMPNDRDPKISINNGAFVTPMAPSAMAPRATHSEVFSFREKEQPQSPIGVAGQPDGVVVVSLQAETAKKTDAITKAMPASTATDQHTATCATIAAKPAIHTTAKPVAPTTPPVANTPTCEPAPTTVKAEIAAILAKIQPQATIAPAPSAIIQPTATIVNGRAIQVKTQVPPPPAPKEPAHPAAFHHSLTRKEAAVILMLMAVLPSDLQQAILAEFIAQLDGGGIRRPVGYARRLIEVAQAGEFVPSASREAAQRVEAEQASAAAERAKAAEERAKADANAVDAAKLSVAMDQAGSERIAELRIEFVQYLKRTNRFAYDMYRADGFDSVGCETLFRGYLREKLLE